MKRAVTAGVVFAGIIFAVVLPRLLPVSAFLETRGIYLRTTEANAQEWASQSVRYTEPSACKGCHQGQRDVWQNSQHKGVSCESCHGPAKAHLSGAARPVTNSSRESCGVCHARVLGRPLSFPQVDPGKHGEQAKCVTCHNPHSPGVGSPATTGLIPHAIEGRADCLACHQSGGMKPYPRDHAGRTSDKCLSCHQGK